MAKKIYSCEQIDIPYQMMIELKQAGYLNLGIENLISVKISNTRGLAPKKTNASAAFHFWNWVALGVLGYTVYLSFTSNWWWFLFGLIGMSLIWKANKKGNSENLLDAAIADEEFYNRVKALGGWIYQIEETEADKLKSSAPS